MYKYFIATLCSGCVCLSANAIGILEIYALAQQKDPQFLAAAQEKIAGEEHESMGRAGLLPSLTLSYQNGLKNWQTAEAPQRKNLLSQQTEKVTTQRQYQSQSGTLTLTQPLFDYEAWASYQLGIAQSLMADARWRVSFMELAVRVVDSYLDVIASQEKVALTERQLSVWRRHLEQNRLLLRAGEGTLTEVTETETRLALAQTDLFAAQDELSKARRALESLIGQPIATLSHLDRLTTDAFQPVALAPAEFRRWQQLALKENGELAAARQQMQISYYQAEQQRAGFYPRIQLYASYGMNHSSSDATIDQRYDTRSVGLQIHYSIYTGGYSRAAVRQADARYNQSKYQLEKSTHEIINSLHDYFDRCRSAAQRLKAYQQAVSSAQQQVAAIGKSIKAGQRANRDLLDAEHQLYQSRLDLDREKFQHLRSWLMLNYYSGQLSPEKLKVIASYFSS